MKYVRVVRDEIGSGVNYYTFDLGTGQNVDGFIWRRCSKRQLLGWADREATAAEIAKLNGEETI